jgi:Methyltransferase domain
MDAATQPVDAIWDTVRALLDAEASPARKDDVAEAIAALLDSYVHSPDYARYFRLWQARGIHVTPVHFYSPIPDTSKLGADVWERETALAGIDLAESRQLNLLTGFRGFLDEYNAFPFEPAEPGGFYLNNPMFSGTDALVLYCMIRQFRPSSIVEVGAGFSTRVLVEAARRNGPTRIVSVDPHPAEALKERALPITLIERPVQELPFSVFESLERDDVLFIDSSHVVRIDGDVPYLFLEVLPRLKPGVIVHVHDIFLPRQLPREWVIDGMRFWCEQYLLQAFLAFNREFEVLLSNSFLGLRHEPVMRDVFPRSPWWGGGSFWMRRVDRAPRS